MRMGMGLASLGRFDNRAVVFAGDSRIAQAFDNSTGRFYLESRGAPAWALPLSGHRFQIMHPNQYGVGGDTTTLLLARWGAVLADPAKTIVLMCGANDRGSSHALQTSIDNMTAMLNSAKAAGKKVILANETPRTGLSAPNLANHVSFHDWLDDAPLTWDNVVVWDTWTPMLDPATEGTTYAPKAGFTSDGLHQTSIGAHAMGGTLATALSTLFSAKDLSRPWAGAGDVVLNSNPAMTGVGGTKGSGFTGNLADGWTASRNSAAVGLAIALSKETDGDEYQVLTVSGTPTTGAPTVTLYQDVTVPANSKFDIRARIKLMSGHSNLLAVTTEARIDTPTVNGRAMDGYQSPDVPPAAGFDLNLWSPPAQVPISGVTTIRAQVILIFNPSVAAAAVVKIARAAARLAA